MFLLVFQDLILEYQTKEAMKLLYDDKIINKLVKFCTN